MKFSGRKSLICCKNRACPARVGGNAGRTRGRCPGRVHKIFLFTPPNLIVFTRCGARKGNAGKRKLRSGLKRRRIQASWGAREAPRRGAKAGVPAQGRTRRVGSALTLP